VHFHHLAFTFFVVTAPDQFFRDPACPFAHLTQATFA
jgi:hypothetical protein